MTKVILSKVGAKEFSKIIHLLTEEDKTSLRYWITFVERYGILKAQADFTFRDHELTGIWVGYRAASFGYSARIIYRVINGAIEIVEIERITTSHNYSR